MLVPHWDMAFVDFHLLPTSFTLFTFFSQFNHIHSFSTLISLHHGRPQGMGAIGGPNVRLGGGSIEASPITRYEDAIKAHLTTMF